jgi:hypothetical protein
LENYFGSYSSQDLYRWHKTRDIAVQVGIYKVVKL